MRDFSQKEYTVNGVTFLLRKVSKAVVIFRDGKYVWRAPNAPAAKKVCDTLSKQKD